MTELKKTPLSDIYKDYGGRVVEFAGWALPVHFSGVIEEHMAVRINAGLFDVSHMGEILVFGSQATDYLDYVLANEISTLKPGRIRYAHICNTDGGVVDDVLVYRLDHTEYMLVVNASNIDKDLQWLGSYAYKDVSIEDVSGATAQLAVQGPKAEPILKKLTHYDLSGMGYYSFDRGVIIADCKCIISRTGYTGEDGFEIYCSPNDAVHLWNSIAAAGEEFGLKPAGLGARDTLRFEACMPLYGHELDQNISPIEAGLKKYIKFGEGSFVGKEALMGQIERGTEKKLAGLEMVDRGIPRNGYPVMMKGKQIGYVTTGSYCPYLQKNLALAIIKAEYTHIGKEVEVEIRGKGAKAKVVETPFYRRLCK